MKMVLKLIPSLVPCSHLLISAALPDFVLLSFVLGSAHED